MDARKYLETSKKSAVAATVFFAVLSTLAVASATLTA